MSREEISVEESVLRTRSATQRLWLELLLAAGRVPGHEIKEAAGPITVCLLSIESIMVNLDLGHLESSRVRCHVDSHVLFSNAVQIANAVGYDELLSASNDFAEAAQELVDSDDGDGAGPCANYVGLMNTLSLITESAMDLDEREMARSAKMRLVSDLKNPQRFQAWIERARNTAEVKGSDEWRDVFGFAVALMNSIIAEVDEDVERRTEAAQSIVRPSEDTLTKSNILAKFADYGSGEDAVDPEVGGS